MSHSRSLPPDLETLFWQLDFFLQKIDPVAGRFEFIESSREILSCMGPVFISPGITEWNYQ